MPQPPTRSVLRLLNALIIAALLPALVLSLLACTTEDEPTDVVTLKAQNGRVCTVDRLEISGTATCEVDASTVVSSCGDGGAVACFSTFPDTDTGVQRLCGACCNSSTRQTSIVSDTCSAITCEAANDCPNTTDICDGGLCKRPN